jgi:hypothetical protein
MVDSHIQLLVFPGENKPDDLLKNTFISDCHARNLPVR